MSTLLISEYIEGSGWNKAIELFNSGTSPIDLADSGYSLQIYHNGKSSHRSIALSGTVPPGEVYIVSDPRAHRAIRTIADLTHGWLAFNGDDAVGLAQNGTVVDQIGFIGSDPGSEWGTGLRSTKDNTLRRLPDSTGTFSRSTAFSLSNWSGHAQDDFTHLGLTPNEPPLVELLLTKYEEGDGQNQSLEITNIGSDDIDFSQTDIEIVIFSERGSGVSPRVIPLTGAVAAGDTFTISNSGAIASLKNQSQQLSSDLRFDGNDAIAIGQGDRTIDSFGQIIFRRSTTPWGEGDFATVNNTLRRKATITIPDNSLFDAFNPEDEWVSVGDAFIISPTGNSFTQSSFPGDFKDLDNADDSFEGTVEIQRYNATNNIIKLVSTNAGVDKPVHIVTGTTGPFNPPLSRDSRPSYLNESKLPVQGIITGGATDGDYSSSVVDNSYLQNDANVRAAGFQERNTPENPDKTWVVIHGWNGNPDDSTVTINRLADKLSNSGNDRVLYLDWREAAADARPPNIGPFGAASWITPVAEFATRALYEQYGLSADQVHLVGHSLGVFVASEIGRFYRDGIANSDGNVVVPGNGRGAQTITALDPASRGAGRFDLDGRQEGDQGPTDLASVSIFSRAFNGVSSIAGNLGYALTADETFGINYGLSNPVEEHQWVVNTFGELLDYSRQNGSPAAFEQLLGRDQYNDVSQLPLSDFQPLEIETPSYMGTIFAEAGGNNSPYLLALKAENVGGEILIGGVEDDIVRARSVNDLMLGSGFDPEVTPDLLIGDAGNDTLTGYLGNDTLLGGDDDDDLFGGDDNDLLVGGEGHDIVTGGAGRDIFALSPSPHESGTFEWAVDWDVITDFDASNNGDFIGLSNEITFSSLSFEEIDFRPHRLDGIPSSGVAISVPATGELLAVFEGKTIPELQNENLYRAFQSSDLITL